MMGLLAIPGWRDVRLVVRVREDGDKQQLEKLRVSVSIQKYVVAD